MPTQLRSQLTPVSAAGLSSETTLPERSETIAELVVQLAEGRHWGPLASYLCRLEEVSQSRGAVLMRALNLPAPQRAHSVLPYLIFYGAPAELIGRVLALGALPAGTVRVQESQTAEPSTITNLHLAALKLRFDVAQVLLREGHSATALNSRAESVAEQFARVARLAELRSEAVILKLGSLVRRMLADGIGPQHLSRLIDQLCERRAWSAAETILDEYTLGPAREPPARLDRNQLTPVAWKAALRRAPPDFFAALRALQHSGQLAGSWVAPEVPATFLTACLPALRRDARDGPWSLFEKRLGVLQLAAEFTQAEFVAALVNGTCDDGLLSTRMTDELVLLGIEDPPTLEGSWSLTHALVGEAAPLPLLERFLKFRPNLSATALILDNGTTICDGTPLHLACSQKLPEHAGLLLHSGAAADALNRAGEVPLHSFFIAHGGTLPLTQVGVVAKLLRAGSPVENRSVTGSELGEQSIVGIPLRRLLAVVEEYEQLLHSGALSPQPPAVIRQFLIDDGQRLVEVDDAYLRSVVLPRLRKFLNLGAGLRLAQMPLADLLQIDSARSAIETLHHSRQPAGESRAEIERGMQPELDEDDDWPAESEEGDEPDEEESEWLPELDWKSEEEEAEEENEEADVEQFPEPDVTAESAPLSSESAGSKAPLTFDEVVAEFLKEEVAAAEKASEEVDDPTPLDDEVTPSNAVSDDDVFDPGDADDYSRLDQNSYYKVAAQFLEEGSAHESYLLLEAIGEATATSPTRLNATTRALRTFLFRAPPGVAQHLGMVLDLSGQHRPDGSHPYMAEYLCLLNHPFDERRDISTIGGLSLGISSVARLVQFGIMRGDLLHEWGRIGALNFSFPFWRFDAQPIQLSGEATTLFEAAGMGRRDNPATTHWINPLSGIREHLWGPVFTVAPGDRFHDNFDNGEARRLGYAALSRSTSIVFRRAGIFIGTADGVLLCRNSSLLFGRDRFAHPGLVCPTPMSVQEIVELTPDDIGHRFYAVTSSEYFNRRLPVKGNSLGSDGTMTLAARHLKHFNDQFQTVRAHYARLKFDTHLETAWSPDGQTLRGGYRSPLFGEIVSLLEDRFERRSPGGSAAIESLAVANPDYPPYAPHAVLAITEQSLEVLRRLAAGKEGQVSSRLAKETGVEEFLNVAFSRGRNSELILMPAREAHS